jgi:hypothetical protein
MTGVGLFFPAVLGVARPGEITPGTPGGPATFNRIIFNINDPYFRWMTGAPEVRWSQSPNIYYSSEGEFP